MSIRGRKTFRETLMGHEATMQLYAALYDKPMPERAIPIPPEPKKRDQKLADFLLGVVDKDALGPQPITSAIMKVPLERDVQKQIIDGLRRHPKVGMVERINSGSAVERNADGSERHIQFHHVYSVNGVRMRAVDISCTLKVGGMRFVIEVKRPGWKAPRGEREEAQDAYIKHVRACGGMGMFATSWEEVCAALDCMALR